MVELRQLQYFMVCVQTGSFSRAAEILCTTQPSVSRVIKALEEELGQQLFERYTKGIGLTAAGKHVYKCSVSIMENVQSLQAAGEAETVETIRLAANPSSWFADAFLEFYKIHQEERLHYRIHSADTHDVARRVQERLDDLGFVYVVKHQLAAFQFFLTRNYLEFEELCCTDIMIYPGALHPWWKNEDGDLALSDLRLVQRQPDEFSSDNYWNIRDDNGNLAAGAEMAVVTNSDYIMERLLKTSDLANISSAYLMAGDSGAREKNRTSGDGSAQIRTGIRLSGDKHQILFGCVKRKNEELPEGAAMFLEFVKEKLALQE